MSLVTALFPGSIAAKTLAKGTEKSVRIDLGNRTKTGRIDAYYGNAVIEFEKSLKATGAKAEEQLREYVAGTWKTVKGAERPLICVAANGVVFKTFRPRVRDGAKGTLKPEDVELEELREIRLTEDTLREFWVWLTSFLFRDALQVEPTAERFCIDFGAGSPAFSDAMDALRAAWARAGSLAFAPPERGGQEVAQPQ